jgi:hypothetical protein
MEHKKSVLIVGFDPVLIDFSSPDFAPQNLSADRVLSAILADIERLRGLGYEADSCLTDLGETAERGVKDKMRTKNYDCVLIGAGIRIIPSSFLLFEKLINVVLGTRRRRNCASILSPATLLKRSCAGSDERP